MLKYQESLRDDVVDNDNDALKLPQNEDLTETERGLCYYRLLNWIGPPQNTVMILSKICDNLNVQEMLQNIQGITSPLNLIPILSSEF